MSEHDTPPLGTPRPRRKTEELRREELAQVGGLAVGSLEAEIKRMLGLSEEHEWHLDEAARDVLRGYIGQAIDAGMNLERTRTMNAQLRREALRAKIIGALAEDDEAE